jgi:sec-independent protein translocase protein TatB
MVALVVIAIVIFGPDKLPKMIGDAARTIRKFREFSSSARTDLKKELGPEFENISMEDLNPKTFVRKHVLGDEEDAFGAKQLKADFTKQLSLDSDDETPQTPQAPKRANGSRIAPGERPPYDADAT